MKFELIQDVMFVLVTAKNKEDLIKNEGTSVFTTIYTCNNFSIIQGQLNPQYFSRSGPNAN